MKDTNEAYNDHCEAMHRLKLEDATEQCILRDWLSDYHTCSGEFTTEELRASVEFLDGDPDKIIDHWLKHGCILREDTSVKHFKVTATIEVEVTAVDEIEAKQKAYDQFESFDMACDLPWKAKVIDPPAGSEAEIDRRNLADYDKWMAKRSDEDVRRDAKLYAETVAFLEKNANNLPS